MFNEYYNEPELTKESFDADGFYKTGDTGDLDAEGYLKVKGRVKDTFKTDKGEFIVPVPIEDRFASNNLIEQLCLVGLSMPQPLGLIRLSEFCEDMDADEIKRSLEDTLKKVNAQLQRNELIQKLICVSDVWSVENGMLTPTMKIKRNVIHEAYKDQYKTWFDQDEIIIMQ